MPHTGHVRHLRSGVSVSCATRFPEKEPVLSLPEKEPVKYPFPELVGESEPAGHSGPLNPKFLGKVR